MEKQKKTGENVEKEGQKKISLQEVKKKTASRRFSVMIENI
jgi:hypothetical protein